VNRPCAVAREIEPDAVAMKGSLSALVPVTLRIALASRSSGAQVVTVNDPDSSAVASIIPPSIPESAQRSSRSRPATSSTRSGRSTRRARYDV
jgi:hypothetical protein